MSEPSMPEAPQTLEGLYLLHDIYTIDWAAWWATPVDRREQINGQLTEWLQSMPSGDQGDTAAYSMLSQKGDLMFLHYRRSPDELNEAELSLRRLEWFGFLRPAYSYFSVIEVSMYELTAIARKKIADQGVTPGSSEYDEAFATEMEKQKTRVRSRLFRAIPDHRYVCFYPMNKRRGEQVNWYNLKMEERRDLMRGHGRIGHKYHESVTQIIGGSVGLDDWEWSVDLHSNDPLVFKKLIYEMRFDPASALYAEFGPFYIGLRESAGNLSSILIR
jgi:chlorite dismutase